ncbi:response regulator [Brevibacillus dissolubilis]|uniref:response regulator n=1 Tax=Brevibacillus dissolubilis TaxID=1844116 RepID=UPI001116FC59|nr:response regulator [Brevibacillus dissolubilis]
MKYKTKLYIGFGAITALMIFLLGIVSSLVTNIHTSVDEIVNDRYKKVEQATIVQNEVNNMTRALTNMLLADNDQQFQEEQNQLKKSRLQVATSLEYLNQHIKLPQGVENLAHMEVAYDNYSQLEKEILEDISAGRVAEASTKITHNAGLMKRELFTAIQNLKQFQEGLLDVAHQRAIESYYFTMKVTIGFVLAGLLLAIGITFWVIRSIGNSLNRITSAISSTEIGPSENLPRIEIITKDEIGEIARAFNQMADSLEKHNKQELEYKEAMQEHNWLKTKVAEITANYQGVQDLAALGQLIITKLSPLVGASYGVFYIKDGQDQQQRLQRKASYAFDGEAVGAEGFAMGEGLVGQCALENRPILLTDVPRHYAQIQSGLGYATPTQVIIMPVEFEGEVLAVIELASLEPFTELHQSLLASVLDTLGAAINSVASNMRIRKLLRESQTLTEELQSQSEELQLQQEELRSINEKLEEQYRNSELKTKELEKVKVDLEEKAKQVQQASQYKSEFLANMSHELRTPLNSLLILAKIMSENKEGNLSQKQVEFAHTIYSAGNDLLHLINDILDLSKVEAGKMSISPTDLSIYEIQAFAERHFRTIAAQKEIQFDIRLAQELPKRIYSDEQRLQQILTNLLSNAFKFTHEGRVTLEVRHAEPEELADHSFMYEVDPVLALSVIDTGIGIPKEKQSIIFEAFQQADGTTSRKYGGTGLGLSISREIAQLLGGCITVNSAEGVGSTFTLYLPAFYLDAKTEEILSLNEAAVGTYLDAAAAPVADEYTKVQDEKGESDSHEESLTDMEESSEVQLAGRKILVVDDDMRNVFALTTALEDRQMNVIFAENGREAIKMMEEHPDTDMVLMDIMMPEMDGYEAMRTIRQMPSYKSLPIIALTAKAMKHDRDKCIEAGASDYISKPVHMDQLFSLMKVWLYKK